MEAGLVREALKTWQDNYIHVEGVMDEFVTLKERTKYLRDEVWFYIYLIISSFHWVIFCMHSDTNILLQFSVSIVLSITEMPT